MRIIADNKIPFLKGVFENVAEIEYEDGAKISKGLVRSADAIVTRTRTKCNQQLLEGSSVKFIASATIGFDHIDVDYCRQKNIEWTNAPGCNAGSVEQYVASVFSALILEKKKILKGKKIAVVGVGNVGKKVSSLAHKLGMKVYEVDPPRARVEGEDGFYNLENIVSEIDIVSFHTPLNREGLDNTFHLCDAKLLSRMKEDVIIINTCRGEVIDSVALKSSLQKDKKRLAAIDVWENEPHIDLELLQQVWMATPHIAGYSQDGKANGTMMSVQAISQKFDLGLDDWKPTDIPQPPNSEILLDCKGLTDEEIQAKACWHTYNIWEDVERLRKKPEHFEKQRGDYPVRREFVAFTVKLQNASDQQLDLVKELGFKNVQII